MRWLMHALSVLMLGFLFVPGLVALGGRSQAPADAVDWRWVYVYSGAGVGFLSLGRVNLCKQEVEPVQGSLSSW